MTKEEFEAEIRAAFAAGVCSVVHGSTEDTEERTLKFGPGRRLQHGVDACSECHDAAADFYPDGFAEWPTPRNGVSPSMRGRYATARGEAMRGSARGRSAVAASSDEGRGLP